MRNICFSFVFLFFCYTAFGQHGWYKTFTGKLGNMDAVVHLASDGGYQGYIWFFQNQYPIRLTGALMQKDSIELMGIDAAINITLTGTLRNDTLAGMAEMSMARGNGSVKKGGFILTNDSKYTPFLYLYVNAQAHLPAKINNESTFEYYKGMVWPAGENSLAMSLKTSLKNFAGIPKDREPATWLFANAEKERVGWQRDNAKLSAEDLRTMGLSLSADYEENIIVMYENDRTITLAKFNYSYTGGAHGNYNTQLINLFKTNGKIIHLQDIISPEGIKHLPEIIEQVARTQYDAPSGSLEDNGFFVSKIPVSKQFYITSDGIGFLYAPYEIKSFADGEINLFVPFTALQNSLKSDFKL